MSLVVSKIKFHNNRQLDYFGHEIKKTMIPVASPYVLRHVREVVSFLEKAPGLGPFLPFRIMVGEKA